MLVRLLLLLLALLLPGPGVSDREAWGGRQRGTGWGPSRERGGLRRRRPQAPCARRGGGDAGRGVAAS